MALEALYEVVSGKEKKKIKVTKVSRIPTELLRGRDGKDGKDGQVVEVGGRSEKIETKREGNLLFVRMEGGEWGEPINLEAEIVNTLGGGVNSYPRVEGDALYDKVSKLEAKVQVLQAQVTGDGAVEYAVRYDVIDSTTSYLGEAAVGSSEGTASWRIKKITTAPDGDVTITHAEGIDTFDKVWNNRLSYTYS